MRYQQSFLTVIPLCEAGYPRVTHPSATQSPLKASLSRCFVRLACVKHAASVHPEPGSNSLNKFVTQMSQLLLSSSLSSSVYVVQSFLNVLNVFVLRQLKIYFEIFRVVSLFSYQGSCLPSHATAFIFYRISLHLSTTFFIFLKLF